MISKKCNPNAYVADVAAAALVSAGPVWAADPYAPAYVPLISDPIYTPGPLVGHLELSGGAIAYGGGDCCNDTLGLFMGAAAMTLQQHDRGVPWDQILGARIYLQ